jgi:hypothetical protein
LNGCFNAGNPFWHQQFWTAVAAQSKHGFPPDIGRLLSFHGYQGAATPIAPRMPELLDSLKLLAAAPAPLGGHGAPQILSPQAAFGSQMNWENGLAPDFKRAAIEIYRSIRQRGHASIRDYLSHNFTGDRNGHVWSDLWTLAQQLDFDIASAHRSGGDAGLFRHLSSSDGAELGLRRVAAYIFEERTHDATAARVIQGTAPPGAKVDVAPSWLVADASQHSKLEYRRDEQVAAARLRHVGYDKQPKPGPKGGDKGTGKDKDKNKKKGNKGGGAAGANP